MNVTATPTTHTLPNGLTVILEPIPDLQSVSFSLLVPSGSAYDPPGHSGSASVLCDWITRGAGSRNSREISQALDRLGVQHQTSVNVAHLVLSGTCLGRHLGESLQIFGEIVQRPHFDPAEFEGAAAGVEHELQALEDDPRQKVMLELVRRFYPAPWNQPPEGTLEDLPNLAQSSVRELYDRCVHPERSILGVAGRIDPAEALPAIEKAFGDWIPGGVPEPALGERGPLQAHVPAESTQTQIGVAFPAVPYRDRDYYAAWAAVSVLSGGMSSRLFTEVREKRGLCYSVYASLSTLKERGAVLCYAGTTRERAQETLDVLLTELKRLEDGITGEELARAQVLARSSLVMQQESSAARARSLARDWFYLGQVRTVDEVQAAIDHLTPSQVTDYVRRHPADPCTIVTIGADPLAL